MSPRSTSRMFGRARSLAADRVRAGLRGPEARLAFRIAWMVLSAVIAGILAAPFVLSGEALARATPVCVWKAKFNREFPGCGLTRSFLHISAGRFGEAFEANRAGPILYAALVANEVTLAAWLLRRRAAQGGLPCKS